MTVTVVVYDERDGEIVHIHDYGALEGAEIPTKSQLENETIDLAVRNTGRQRSEFATLHVQAEDMREDVEYKVDVRNYSLVAKDDSHRKEKKSVNAA